MNPAAFVLIAFCAVIGVLAGSLFWGLAVGLGLVLTATVASVLASS